MIVGRGEFTSVIKSLCILGTKKFSYFLGLHIFSIMPPLSQTCHWQEAQVLMRAVKKKCTKQCLSFSVVKQTLSTPPIMASTKVSAVKKLRKFTIVMTFLLDYTRSILQVEKQPF